MHEKARNNLEQLQSKIKYAVQLHKYNLELIAFLAREEWEIQYTEDRRLQFAISNSGMNLKLIDEKWYSLSLGGINLLDINIFDGVAVELIKTIIEQISKLT